MECLDLLCPSKEHPGHVCHDVIASSHSGVGSVSKFAGQYPPAFVEHALQTIPAFVKAREASLAQCHDELLIVAAEECLAAQREDIVKEEVDEARVLSALRKLHKNKT